MHQEGLLNLEEVLLAACVPVPETNGPVLVAREKEAIDNIDILVSKVRKEMWSSEMGSLFAAMFEYRIIANGALTEAVLLDMLTRAQAPVETRVKYQALFWKLQKQEVSPATFRYSLSKFQSDYTEKQYLQALNESYTIYKDGLQVGKQSIKGYRSSREYLQSKLFELDTGNSMTDVVEGSPREETNEVWNEYQERKKNPDKFKGVLSGFAPLDDATFGAKRGEIWFVLAYTGQGKTKWLQCAAHHAVTVQGKNVVAFTSEVLYHQWRLGIIIRHSRQPQFGLPYGISSKAFERGTLSQQEEDNFQKVLEDFKTNPRYGRFKLIQVPQSVGVAGMAARLHVIDQNWPVDAAYLDYLRIMIPHQKGARSELEELNQGIREAKSLAITFRHGAGLPVFSGWQSNRKAFEEAIKRGHYTIKDAAEAGELEKSADVLHWMLQTDEMRDKREILGGIAKARSSKTAGTWIYVEDFDANYLGISSQSAPTPATATSPMNNPFAQRSAGLF